MTADTAVYDPYPSRKSMRADWIDHDSGTHFVTICVRDMEHAFGEIRDGTMQLTEVGAVADAELAGLAIHHPRLRVLRHTVMPNHLHALIHITDSTRPAGTGTVLGNAIALLKQHVTIAARRTHQRFAWQRNYYDHAVRDQDEFDRINAYIAENVTRWRDDRYHR